MNVVNLMFGDCIEVVFKYMEMLVFENGVYEFVYFIVVGLWYNELLGVEN